MCIRDRLPEEPKQPALTDIQPEIPTPTGDVNFQETNENDNGNK